MAIKIIAAVAQNGVIGANGKIPWHIPEDLKRFSKLTKGYGNNAVIMGRKTWESIPEKYRPLPGRRNIVVTSRWTCSGEAQGLPTLWEAIVAAEDCDDIWLIGGQGIYQEALSKYLNRTDGFEIDEVHLTLVDEAFEGDTFFPYLALGSEFAFEFSTVMSHEGLGYSFVSHKRKA
jgi:dihydrofolate reductase